MPQTSPPAHNEDPNSAPDASISHSDALAYWTSVPATVNAMLGGYPQVSRVDLQGSANFLAKLKRRRPAAQDMQATEPSQTPAADKNSPLEEGRKLRTRGTPTQNGVNAAAGSGKGDVWLQRAVDCGAGIGRVTIGLLCRVASIVDVVEPVDEFTLNVSEGEEFAALREKGKIGRIYNIGLESWNPKGPYDLIWNQWCLGQLKDAQLEEYLRRCISSLAPSGYVVVKENMSTDSEAKDIFDATDSSVTRSDGKYRHIFDSAGLKVVAHELQRGLPDGLYPVRTYALQPR